MVKTINNLLILMAFGLFIASCSNDTDPERLDYDDNLSDNVSSYNYFIDGELVAEYDRSASPYHIAVTLITDPNEPESLIEEVHAFTTDSKYLAWGEENNFNVAKYFEVEAFIASVKSELEIDENTDESDEIFDVLNSKVEKFLTKKATNERAINLRYDLDNCWGSMTFMPYSMSAMGSLSNRLTKVRSYGGTGGILSMYDSNGYQDHLQTLYLIPFKKYCLGSSSSGQANSYWRT